MDNQKVKPSFVQRMRRMGFYGIVASLALASSLAFAQGNSANHISATGAAHSRAHNVSREITAAINAASVSNVHWAKDTPRGRLLQVIVVADNINDKTLTGLRRAIVQAGGSVHHQFNSVVGLSALLPAAKIAQIASRSDVLTVAPNRVVARTQSLLQTETGAADVRSSVGSVPSLDGSGVAIAVLDSGIMSTHNAFVGPNGTSRVVARTDLTPNAAQDWTTGVDTSLVGLNGGTGSFQDPYGHGTIVASVAAGVGASSGPDAGGIAPGASLVDVRVLDSTGTSDLATAISGIDWVLAHAKDYGIRVLNVSLGADSTDSYLDDPFCRAVRTAVASGITVVVAAGNYGLAADGSTLVYGSISSPGDEPSVITVGSANTHDTASRSDDTVNFFSSKGPTRGSYVDANGAVHYDNLVKPDVVAPGNRLLAAMSTDTTGSQLNAMASLNPGLIVKSGPTGAGLMLGSGTSFAAPVIAGTAALLLQANPGLTPSLIKAILQYSAQPIAGANLIQQGAGEVNVPGAVALATALSTDIASRVANGSIAVGDSMLAAGQSLPAPWSIINGVRVDWARFVVVGGAHVAAGTTLLTNYQAIYDPEIVWVGNTVTATTPTTTGSNSTTGYTDAAVASGAVLSGGVYWLDSLLGASDPTASTGDFTPSATVSAQVSNGQGVLLDGGVVLSNGITLGEGITWAEGLTLGEGLTMSEGLTLAEGLTMGEGVTLSEGLTMGEGVLGVGPTRFGAGGEL